MTDAAAVALAAGGGSSNRSLRATRSSKVLESFAELNAELHSFELLDELKSLVAQGAVSPRVFELLHRDNVEDRLAAANRASSSSAAAGAGAGAREAKWTVPPLKESFLDVRVGASSRSSTTYTRKFVRLFPWGITHARSENAKPAAITTASLWEPLVTVARVAGDALAFHVSFPEHPITFRAASEAAAAEWMAAVQSALDVVHAAKQSRDEPVHLFRTPRSSEQITLDLQARIDAYRSSLEKLNASASAPAVLASAAVAVAARRSLLGANTPPPKRESATAAVNLSTPVSAEASDDAVPGLVLASPSTPPRDAAVPETGTNAAGGDDDVVIPTNLVEPVQLKAELKARMEQHHHVQQQQQETEERPPLAPTRRPTVVRASITSAHLGGVHNSVVGGGGGDGSIFVTGRSSLASAVSSVLSSASAYMRAGAPPAVATTTTTTDVPSAPPTPAAMPPPVVGTSFGVDMGLGTNADKDEESKEEDEDLDEAATLAPLRTAPPPQNRASVLSAMSAPPAPAPPTTALERMQTGLKIRLMSEMLEDARRRTSLAAERLRISERALMDRRAEQARVTEALATLDAEDEAKKEEVYKLRIARKIVGSRVQQAMEARAEAEATFKTMSPSLLMLLEQEGKGVKPTMEAMDRSREQDEAKAVALDKQIAAAEASQAGNPARRAELTSRAAQLSRTLADLTSALKNAHANFVDAASQETEVESRLRELERMAVQAAALAPRESGLSHVSLPSAATA